MSSDSEEPGDSMHFEIYCDIVKDIFISSAVEVEKRWMSWIFLVPDENRLSEQLTSNAERRALKLELENRRLSTLIDSMKETSFHENSTHVLELEKEKKKLSLKIESLNDNNERLTQQNSDLELVCKQALEENKKLQNNLKNQRASSEKQQHELQVCSIKIISYLSTLF